jgi:translation initiation factor 3 subunit G
MLSPERENATLRVSNISSDTKEADLHELFKIFGSISRIYLAKHRDTNESRGFAYVSYHSRDDAERARAELDGHGYDHLILKLEWAKPSNPDEKKEGGLAGGYTSGYGKALAQDTKEKAVYH